MTMRRGQREALARNQFAPIDLHRLIEDFTMRAGETIADVYSRLDPERAAHVLGVTRDGQFDTAAVSCMGEKLFTNGQLGVDILVIPPGSGFPPHIHPGHHLLYCIQGNGTFTLDEVVHQITPGYLWTVEGDVPHAVGNPYDEPHIVVATGSPHRELDSPERMKVVNWHGHPLHVPLDHNGHVPPTPDHPHNHEPDPSVVNSPLVRSAVRAGLPG